MKLTLVSKKIHSASLENIQVEPVKKPVKANVSLTNEIYANTKDSRLFRIRYISSITVEGVAKLNISYDFDFKADVDFTGETASSIEVRSIAPAMAYPYIKSYAELMISMSGLGDFNLPYFDFIDDPFDKPE